jgi:hypothetical protein
MIPAWLLALIVLIISSAVGVYYLKPALFVPEGFFSVKTDGEKCERSRNDCIDVGGDNVTCTTIYNDCTRKAALANMNVSTTATKPSDPTQTSTSASAAQVYATLKGATGDLGTGDKTLIDEYAARQNSALTGTTPKSSDAYKKLLISLSERMLTRDDVDKPTASQLSLAQGDDTGYLGTEAGNYTPHQEIIKAHMTPTELKAAIFAKVQSDKGTQAQTIQEEAILTPSIREMIRTDVKKAIKDEIHDINNEYEIQYDSPL